MFLEFRDIVSPISADLPCGVNMRTDPKGLEKYYSLKDLRNVARSAERNVVPGEPMKLAAEWHDVDRLCSEILGGLSKDIEILAWAAEAQIRLDGYAGLRDVFRMATDLFATYWDEIHSVDHDTTEEKIAPFAGLNGVSGEGTLIQAIRLTPLIPGISSYATHTLWDYQLAQRPGEERRRETLHELANDAGRDAMASRLGEVTECLEAFAELTAVLDEKCGADAPPSANTTNVLTETAAAIRDLAGLLAPVDAQPVETQQAEPAKVVPVVASTALGSLTLSSREDAFDALLAIARYFRRTEPHSPMSMSIETLVRRGRMDFSELLNELLPEAHTRNAVLTAAGIQPKPDHA